MITREPFFNQETQEVLVPGEPVFLDVEDQAQRNVTGRCVGYTGDDGNPTEVVVDWGAGEPAFEPPTFVRAAYR